MNKGINNNGYEYVDLCLPSGTLWATMNVGALKPSDAGLYFQWGDTSGYTADQVGKDKQFDWANYKWCLSEDSWQNIAFTKYTTECDTLELEDDAAHIHMGGDWYMPTADQMQELVENTTINCEKINGVEGMMFTSKKDKSKSIFIPTAGYASFGSIKYSRSYGSIWSSSINSSGIPYADELEFSSECAYLSENARYYGLPVRGVIGKRKNTNGDLNLIEILRYAPKGIKLWSYICGDCYFKSIREKSHTPIVCKAKTIDGNFQTICFTKEGTRNFEFANGECVLFPSKDNKDWSIFKM